MHPDRNEETDDEKIARALDSVTESSTAIERQIAAVAAARNDERPAHLDAGARLVDYNTHHRKPRRIGFGSFLALLLVAGVLIFAFTDFGSSLRKTVGAVPLATQPASQTKPLLPTANSTSQTASAPKANSVSAAGLPPVPDNSQAPDTSREPGISQVPEISQAPGISQPPAPRHSAETLQTAQPPQTAQPSQVPQPPQTAQASPAPAPTQATSLPSRELPPKPTEESTSAVLSVPVADVSLRNRPELLEQLVQIYRSQLAANPGDATAQAALDKLREQSLSELQTIIAQGDDSSTVKSLAMVSRVFPELADNPRYKYLIARMDYMHREQKTEPVATAAAAAPSSSLMPASAKAGAPAKSMASVRDNSAVPAAEKNSESAASSKPDIRVLSITPGTMVDKKFVPADDGDVFMVEISYRNFDKLLEDETNVALVARLGVPGDSMVLAEAPVDILGDRGTKSFLMESLVPGNIGGKCQLNFILNGDFLASRTVRLSRPGY